MVPQPELRNQPSRSKLSKFGEIDGVYQLRDAMEGRIRLCGSSVAVGRDASSDVWRAGVRKKALNDEWPLGGGTLEEATRLSVELRSNQMHPEHLWFAHPDLRLQVQKQKCVIKVIGQHGHQ